MVAVHPAHIAFVMLNEGSDAIPGAMPNSGGGSLFSSVIQRAGGDPVSISLLIV